MKLAPVISIHGVLVDVFGEGVLIMGESGIGKSEAALELIKRGHRQMCIRDRCKCGSFLSRRSSGSKCLLLY